MVKNTKILILAGMIIAIWQVQGICAEVVIKVRALNPLNTKETAVINYPLPDKVKESDILRQKITYSMDHSEEEEPPKQSFQISFDEKKGTLYVDDEVILLPKEVVTLEVHVNDVWIIEQSQVENLRQEVNDLLVEWEEQMKPSPEEADQDQEGDEESIKEVETKEFALVMRGEIIKGLDEIIARQNQNKIILVGVERHIAAYEENIEELRQVQQDIVLLANLIQFDIDAETQPQESEEEELPETDEQDSGELPDIAQDEIIEETENIEENQGLEQKI